MASNRNYDEIQRQIEKEQIREQIIAEEILRRRILEEEVRRELMMEKKIPFRSLEPSTTSFGCSCRISPFLVHEQSRIPCEFGHFDDSRTGSIFASTACREIVFRGSEKLPFQRYLDPVSPAGLSVVSNGIQPLLHPSKLAILETNVSGQKRKSPIPEADYEFNNINSNKKLRGWNCTLCNVCNTSEIDLNRHKQGRKHRAKEAALTAHERRFDATAVSKEECNSSNENPGVNKSLNAGRDSSESVHGEAAEAGKQSSIQKMNIVTYPRSNRKARDADSNGDMPIKAMPSAKSSEESKLWCDLCQVGATCAKDMTAHNVGKKHLAKLRKDMSAKEMSRSAKYLSKTKDLPKKTVKEITQNRLESTFSPFEMEKTVNANVVDTRLVFQMACFGASPAVKNLRTEMSDTAMVSTCDPGVEMTFNANGNSSENVDDQAAAEEQNSIENLNGKTDPTSNLKATDVDLNGNGDRSGPQTTLLSAKLQEKISDSIEGGNVLPYEVMQIEQESNVIPSEVKETVKNTKHGLSRGDGNCVLSPLSATSESGLDEHKAKEADLNVPKKFSAIPEESVVTLSIKEVRKDEQGRYVSATRKGDETKKASGKSGEKLKFRYQMCQVGTSSAEFHHDKKLYGEPCALPESDVCWIVEEGEQEVIGEDV